MFLSFHNAQMYCSGNIDMCEKGAQRSLILCKLYLSFLNVYLCMVIGWRRRWQIQCSFAAENTTAVIPDSQLLCSAVMLLRLLRLLLVLLPRYIREKTNLRQILLKWYQLKRCNPRWLKDGSQAFLQTLTRHWGQVVLALKALKYASINQTPHRDEWGARSEWKNLRAIRIILHFLYESAIRGGSGQEIRACDWHPNRCRTLRKYSRIITYPCRMGQTLRINSPYLMYALTMFTYQPSTVVRMNYTIIHGDTHATIKVTVQPEHEPYQSNGDTFDTNPLRIIRATLRTLQYRPYKTYC